jgi:hypothetical protein
MKEEIWTDALLREFLLGKVDDADRARIEDLLLTNREMQERVFALEQDLIEDYLEDSLSEEEKEKFLSLYAQTEEQRRKLRITASIKNWAVREAAASKAVATAPTASVWSQFWARFGLKPRFLVPIAVSIVVAVVLAIVWINSLTAQQQHLALSQELAQLNSPANRSVALPEMTSFDLRAVSVRSIEPQTELRIPAGARFVELNLYWTRSERYPTYQVQVRRIRDRESFTIPNLQAESDGRYTIRVKLPTRLFTTGDYQINLTGVSADGSAGPSEEFAFAVSN